MGRFLVDTEGFPCYVRGLGGCNATHKLDSRVVRALCVGHDYGYVRTGGARDRPDLPTATSAVEEGKRSGTGLRVSGVSHGCSDDLLQVDSRNDIRARG